MKKVKEQVKVLGATIKKSLGGDDVVLDKVIEQVKVLSDIKFTDIADAVEKTSQRYCEERQNESRGNDFDCCQEDLCSDYELDSEICFDMASEAELKEEMRRRGLDTDKYDEELKSLIIIRLDEMQTEIDEYYN